MNKTRLGQPEELEAASVPASSDNEGKALKGSAVIAAWGPPAGASPQALSAASIMKSKGQGSSFRRRAASMSYMTSLKRVTKSPDH